MFWLVLGYGFLLGFAAGVVVGGTISLWMTFIAGDCDD